MIGRILIMKATLEFNLDDPDDSINHMRCIKSLDMACVLFEINNIKRSYLKYSELSKEEDDLIRGPPSDPYGFRLSNLMTTHFEMQY